MSLEDPTFNKYSLPVVSSQVAQSLLADAIEVGPQTFLRTAEDRLSVNNPELYLAVGRFAQGLGLATQGEINIAHKVMVVTHEYLRRQAETNLLNGQFNTPGE